MKKIDLANTKVIKRSRYPSPFDKPCLERARQRLGDAAGLTRFGVNLLRLPPGAWSSQRHWHSHQDEFVFVVEGEVVLVTDAGEEILKTGDSAGFKAGDPDGHHLINRSGEDAAVLEIGDRAEVDKDGTVYPDIDMIHRGGEPGYRHRDGAPY